MTTINENLQSIKGYYCNYCNKFYTEEQIKKTYTVEVIGDNIKIKEVEISCPECGHHSDLEDFYAKEWTPLAALIEAHYKGKVWIKIPIYDDDNATFPTAYKTVHSVREVELYAGRLCVEVLKASIDEFDLMDVEVDFV